MWGRVAPGLPDRLAPLPALVCLGLRRRAPRRRPLARLAGVALLLLAAGGVDSAAVTFAPAAQSAGQTPVRKPAADIETLRAAGNSQPYGLWGDGETLWVVDHGDQKLYAYDLGAGGHTPERDIDVSAVTSPTGVWSDGETIWVLSYWGGAFAYDLGTGEPVGARDRPGIGGGGAWGCGRTGRPPGSRTAGPSARTPGKPASGGRAGLPEPGLRERQRPRPLVRWPDPVGS